MNTKYLIIGASAAGISAANTLRRLDPEGSIFCVTREKETPYNKCFLADYAAGVKELSELSIFTEQEAIEKNIIMMRGVEITALDFQNNYATTASGMKIGYQSLLIATGSSPVIPEIEGMANIQRGVFTFHTQHDAQAILDYIKKYQVTSAVIIGSGLSGVECADSLNKRGVQVAVIERSEHILSTQIPADMAQIIEERMRVTGIKLYSATQVDNIENQQGVPIGVRLSNGELIEAQMIIFTTGLRPDSQLALKAGITLYNSGIITDDGMMTSSPRVYAAGDVALVKDQVTGEKRISTLWPDAMFQGLVAAHGMAGHTKTYPGVVQITSSAFFGLKYAAYGPLIPEISDQVIQHVEEQDTLFIRIILKENGYLGSFFLLNKGTRMVPHLKRLLLTRQELKKSQVQDFISQV